MTKEDIVDRIRDASDTLTKKQSAEVLNKFMELLKQTLKEESELKISSFGKFYVQRRKPRIGRNPKTGEEALIKEGKTIKFRPGKPFKAAVLN